MDVPRKSAKKKRQVRRILYILTAVVAVAVITVGVSRLKPAAPYVEPSTLYKDTVKRGPMTRAVRGLGTLVPEEIRYIPAISLGRVEKRFAQPGSLQGAAKETILHRKLLQDPGKALISKHRAQFTRRSGQHQETSCSRK